jgi:tripartite ATP-independent transporter DctP family solute receptor
MMLKKFRCLVLAMALILVVISCNTFAADKPVKLIFGHTFDMNYFFVKGDKYFKELVEKNSKGQILIDYFPAAQLGSQTEELHAVKSGAQQMTMVSGGVMAPFWGKLATFDLPYLYRDQKHIVKVAEKITSLIDQDEMAAKTGMRILSARIRPARHLTTRFPVKKWEDIKGLKIRVPDDPVSIALWKALGALPTSIPGAEVYTALATGVVDAQENPLDGIYSLKIYELLKYCAITSHKQEVVLIAINNKFWSGLTAAQQKIIQDALDKSSKLMIKAAVESEKEAYKLLAKSGMKFTKPNLAPFREKSQKIWGQFGDQELIKKVEAVK